MENVIPRIESQDLSLDKLFNDFYQVPDFQREYVWEEEDVERLLDDSFKEFYDDAGRVVDGPEYFIGSIVVSPDDDGVLELIDGQQRMTTIFLFYCAVRDVLMEAEEEPQAWLVQRIRDSQLDPATGNDIDRYRLVLQYRDADGVLAKLAARSHTPGEIEVTTESVRRLLAAYRTIRDFISTNFRNDPTKVKQFLATVSSRVKLIRIETPSVANALKVFETINDRGVGLTAMDLLKNLVFMNSSDEDFEWLKERWKEIGDTIDACNDKPLRFLRYYILSHHEVEGDVLREDDVYDWFRDNASDCGIDRRPREFTEYLLRVANDYANFIRGNGADGEPNQHIRNIFAMNRQARQHFVLLLAARGLPRDTFDRLCHLVENLFFVYSITRVNTNVSERNFARWANDLRAVRDDGDLDAFAELYFEQEMLSRARDFRFAIEELDQGRVPKYRMKYILAKLTQHIECAAWGNPAHDTLDNYLDASVQTEHILPQNPRLEVFEAFDKPEEYQDWVSRFGNLTLLERPINASVKDGTLEEKAAGYTQSRFLLTQSIVEKPTVGQNTSINRAVSDLIEFDHWDSETIEERQVMLTRLAHTVWDMPQPEGAEGGSE